LIRGLFFVTAEFCSALPVQADLNRLAALETHLSDG
jgi:hypothetical protein